MKLLRFLGYILVVLCLIIIGLYISGNQYLIKGAWVLYLHGDNTATIDDAQYFNTNTVKAGEKQAWKLSKNYNKKELSTALNDILEESNTVAFLVIKNDEIQYEKYWNGYNDTVLSNSFSMAKSITTMLAQIAIQQGYFKSWDDKVIQYLPDIEGPYSSDLTLKHLSTMSAGLQWEEGYKNPFGVTAKAYYGPNTEQLLYDQVPVVNPPGKEHIYQSGAPQYLGLAIAKATGKTISEYASENLWKPIGAAHNATWHKDGKNGVELTYCCFNSNARDFARFGKLLINYGRWNDQQILDSAFVAMASTAQYCDYYGYSFWIDTDDHLTPVYYMRGFLGQYVIVIPEKDLVITRLGTKQLEKVDKHTRDFHTIVSEVIKYF